MHSSGAAHRKRSRRRPPLAPQGARWEMPRGLTSGAAMVAITSGARSRYALTRQDALTGAPQAARRPASRQADDLRRLGSRCDMELGLVQGSAAGGQLLLMADQSLTQAGPEPGLPPPPPSRFAVAQCTTSVIGKKAAYTTTSFHKARSAMLNTFLTPVLAGGNAAAQHAGSDDGAHDATAAFQRGCRGRFAERRSAEQWLGRAGIRARICRHRGPNSLR